MDHEGHEVNFQPIEGIAGQKLLNSPFRAIQFHEESSED
jgi:hypothetical protein